MFRLCLMLWLIISLAACNQNETAPPEDSPPSLEPIQLGVGFVPNIQFAPFYVAQAKGFYATEGLTVTLEYGFENDFVALTARGERQFAIASGDQVILSRAQALPVVYVMKWYDRFPIAVISEAAASQAISQPADLAGHTVGIPGQFGASYVGWRAFVYATELDESAVTMENIGFTQAEALSTGQVDAAVVYLTNEPVQLTMEGLNLNIFPVSDYINLVSNGLVTNEQLIQDNPDLVGRMVRATLQGIEYTLENPNEAFEISRQAIPEMTEEDVPAQRAVLEASLSLWRSDQMGLSQSEIWTEMATFMAESGLIENEVDVESLYTNEFVPE